MTAEHRHTRGNSHEIVSREKPRLLTHNELVTRARKDFSGLTGNLGINPEAIEPFIAKKVTGFRINGVDVISIDINLEPEGLDPLAKAYMHSPRTKVVMPEYFYPELKENAGILSSRMDKLARKVNPEGKWSKRLHFAEMVEEACRESGKPVAVADIANKPSYMVLRAMQFLYPPAIGSLVSYLTHQDTAENIGEKIEYAYLAALLYMNQDRAGIFNPDRIPKLDRFIPDIEQARRLFLAKGIEQLTTDYSPQGNLGDEAPQIVALYPRAHGIRVADILVNPHPHFDKAKSVAYRALGPTLDYSVRTYRWDDSLQRLVASGYRWGQPNMVDSENTHESLAGWMKVSDRKIKI